MAAGSRLWEGTPPACLPFLCAQLYRTPVKTQVLILENTPSQVLSEVMSLRGCLAGAGGCPSQKGSRGRTTFPGRTAPRLNAGSQNKELWNEFCVT